ncbi:MAG: type III pantothenate kinase [Bacteroidales bacterium]|jgi:type III pantothenate kinase|nr:type III pantothenate kinase [Bacteroidales bacterium]
MNLVLDIGNSGFKMAVFDGRIKILSTRINELISGEFENIVSGFAVNRAVISSVSVIPQAAADILSSHGVFVHILSYRSKLPFGIQYKTPETLGTDRIAALAGAFSLFPGEDIMIIDAGTAITYDFLTGGIYEGGNISPGINIRLKALHSFTGRLPLTSAAEKFSSPGQTTRDAILSGTVNGVIYEINEYIRTFKKMHKNNKIILTGGDSEYINERLNDNIMLVPDLVNEGLNFILEYNA